MGEVFSAFVRFFVKNEVPKGAAEAEAAAKNASKSADAEASKASGSMSKAIGVLGGVGKAAAAGVSAAAGAIGTLGAAAINGYSQFEQLTGGVDKLFGSASGKVQQYAAQAFQTAGMSANQYMEQVTSFSSALVQSLGGDTDAAADKANMALTDMADNVNVFGSNMTDVQNAYQGFAKQNYTMLDNLKLGYGGTQEEMQRLLKDAEAISGVHYDISSYADVVDAIHVIQTQMGITGTTSKEAAQTIEGSVNMTKAAWSNWVTGLANDNANMRDLTTQLVESVGHVVDNVAPRILQIASSLTTALPQLINSVLPIVIQTLQAVITGLVIALPPMLQAILPPLITAVVQIVQAIAEILPVIIPILVDAVVQLINAVVTMLPTLVPILLQAALVLFMAIVEAVPQILPPLIAAVPQIVDAVCNFLPQLIPALLQAAVVLFLAIVDAVPQILSALISSVGSILNTVVKYVPTFVGLLLIAAGYLFMAIARAVPGVLGSVVGALGNLLSQLPGKVSGFAGSMARAAGEMMMGMVRGIGDKARSVADSVVNVAKGALNNAKRFLGIASPSKVMRRTFRWVPIGAALGVDDEAEAPVRSIADMGRQMQEAADGVTSKVNLGAIASVKAPEGGVIGTIGQAVKNVTQNINVKTGETDPKKLAKMIAREERRNAYALGAL